MIHVESVQADSCGKGGDVLEVREALEESAGRGQGLPEEQLGHQQRLLPTVIEIRSEKVG